MKALFLDVYKDSNTRVSKDTAGGYGTENKLGRGMFAPLAERMIKNGVFWPNLGFMHSVNELKSRGFDVSYQRVIDRKSGDFLGEIESQRPDVIFLCSSLVCFETELSVAVELSRRMPDVKVVLLGQIALELRDEIPPAINIVGGNYEFLFSNQLQFSKFFEGLSAGRQIIERDQVPTEGSLLPIDWSLFGGGFDNRLFTKKKNYPVLTSRGCPYSCIEYCSYPVAQGRKVRHENVSETINNLRSIEQINPNGHVIFRDPVFTISRPRTLELLKAMAEADLRLTCTAELHLKNCDEQTIDALRKANVTHVKFGIESSSEFVRKGSFRYSVSNDEQKKIIHQLKLAGITTDGMFILGMPDDSHQSMNDTIDYACSLGLDFAQFSIFTPYPGTERFEKMKSLMNFDRYEQLNQFSLRFKHKKLSPEDVERALYRAYFKFYKNKLVKVLGLL